jgi:streptomycin 6-kinase
MRHLTVQPDAAARVVAILGDAGRAWIRGAPDLVASLLAEWSLTPDGPPFTGGYASLVLPVTGAGAGRLVLKLAPSAAWIADESRALAHWDGHGSVRLIRVDLERGALLCERAIPGQSLLDTPDIDDDGAAEIVAGVIAQLAAAPAPAATAILPTLESWTENLRAHVQSPLADLARTADRAHRMAGELLASSSSRIVLHGDLHPGNVLRASRQPWLAIDPKGLVGPAAAEAAAYLRNPRRWLLDQPDATAIIGRRMDLFAERLDCDVREIAGWAYVLAVLSAAWAVEDHELAAVIDRALRCAVLLEDVVRGG